MLLTVAIFAACEANEEKPDPTELPVTNGSFTTSIGNAESLLGFDVRLPSYVPEPLVRQDDVQLVVRGGEPYEVAVVFSAPDPGLATKRFAGILLLERNRAPPGNFGLGEPVDVNGRNVYINTDSDSFNGEWLDDDLWLNLTLSTTGGGASVEDLRNEGLLTIRSMIE
jgi:hypothetical protein